MCLFIACSQCVIDDFRFGTPTCGAHCDLRALLVLGTVCTTTGEGTLGQRAEGCGRVLCPQRVVVVSSEIFRIFPNNSVEVAQVLSAPFLLLPAASMCRRTATPPVVDDDLQISPRPSLPAYGCLCAHVLPHRFSRQLLLP